MDSFLMCYVCVFMMMALSVGEALERPQIFSLVECALAAYLHQGTHKTQVKKLPMILNGMT